MQWEKKSRIALFIIAAAGMLLSWILMRHVFVYRPSGVYEAKYLDGYLYGLESGDRYFRIFRVNVDTRESATIRIPMNQGHASVTISNLIPAEDGTVYVSRTVMADSETEQWIDVCDFERRRLIPSWNLKEFLPEGGVFAVMARYMDTVQVIVATSAADERYLLRDGEWIEDLTIQNRDMNAYVFEVTEDGGYYIFQTYGKFYRLNENGGFDCVYEAGLETDPGFGYNFQFYKDEIYYEDVNDGRTFRIDVTKRPFTAEVCERTYPAAETFDETRMTLVSFTGKTAKAGVLSLEDGRKVAAVCGEKEYVAENLGRSGREFLVSWAILSLGILFAGTAVIFIWKYMRRKERAIPLVGEAAFLTLALMAAGFWFLRSQILHSIETSTVENNIEACLQLGYERMEIFNTANLQTMCGFDRITEDNQLPVTLDMSAYGKLEKEDAERNAITLLEDGINYQLYFMKNSEIYPIGPSLYVLNMPLEYNLVAYDFLALQAMKQALANRQAVTIQYADLDGMKYAVFLPFETGDDEYPMLLEVAMTLETDARIFAAQAVQVERLILWLGAVLLTVMLFVLWLGMKPLGILKQAAFQIIKGNLGVQARVKGRSEVAWTAMRFNHMSKQLADQIRGVNSYQKKYAAFIPLDFLEQAGNSVNSQGPFEGQVNQKRYMVMTVGIRNKEEVASQIMRIHEKKGEILAFENGGLSCLFLGRMENALEAAVNLLQDAKPSEEKRIHIAISFEEVRLGVTGNSQRSAVTAFNVSGNSNQFLKQCAEKYRASLLITGSAADRIEGFYERYHTRRLGSILMKNGNRTEEIYEVLDGEPEASKRRKLLTAESFAEGLRAFECREYLAARTAFIRVLLKNSQDTAALCYVRLCDGNLWAEPDKDIRYLEIY